MTRSRKTYSSKIGSGLNKVPLLFAVPSSRAGKIIRFKHYHTDAPI